MESLECGDLTVCDILKEKEGRTIYLCQCSCGKFTKVRKTDFHRQKIDACRSCRKTASGNHNWKGCGELSGTYWKRLKANACRRKSGPIVFEITMQYAWALYQKQNGRCALTGWEIPMPKKVEDGFVASLDRIDSTQGYIEGNVQWVHKELNRAKMDSTQSRFIEICKAVAEHQRWLCSLS